MGIRLVLLLSTVEVKRSTANAIAMKAKAFFTVRTTMTVGGYC